MSDRPRRDTSRSRSRRRSRSRSASRHRRRHRLHEHCHERTYESDQELAGAADGSEQLKLANREHVAARARMWTVVDSDRSGSDAESDAATTTKRKKKKRRRRETSSHGRDRRRRRDRSSSASSAAESKSSDSSDSSDTSEDERVQRKRRHKSRRSKDDKKKKKKKEKKRKKDGGRKLAVDQDEYGKYGILRESDLHRKSVSFHAWLRDVKKMGAFNGPKWEAMELFKEYMEDYNTCTMPHKKYYDIEKYEMEQYQKQQRKAFDKQKKASSVKALDAVADEERVRRERLDARGKKEQEEFRLVLQLMDKDKIEAMREQERLRSQMQLMYKSGNVGEARRLEQILNKVEEDPRFKR